MTPYYADDHVTVHHGDCLDVLRELADNSVDAVVTDPPYEISFMSKTWDGKGIAFNPVVWQHCWRVLRPGGHMLAFGGTRTWHRLASAIEDAGFEIRDSICWLYGSGFPKSLDVSKAIDKAAGAERKVVGQKDTGMMAGQSGSLNAENGFAVGHRLVDITAPATDAAKQWQGWGTALKPAFEPIVVARKPLQGTVAANVLAHGTGALNIDGCRVDANGERRPININPGMIGGKFNAGEYESNSYTATQTTAGRWPANVLLDDSQAVALDRESGVLKTGGGKRNGQAVEGVYGDYSGSDDERTFEANSGGASRFFPTFKNEEQPPGRWPPNVVLDDSQAAALDRESGNSTSPGTYERSTVVENHIYGASNARPVQHGHGDSGGASRFFPTFHYTAKAPGTERPTADGVAHPTVKPLDLMRWLIRLVTPPNGVVLDPFAGSGTTGEAAIHEHKRAILIEKEADYLPLIVSRLSKPMAIGFDFDTEVGA